MPFKERNRDYFFGRSSDIRIIAANLRNSSLTVLYGASGVGKSSVLLAGVVPELKKSRDHAVAVFRDWVNTGFLDELKQRCAEALTIARPEASLPHTSQPLDELVAWANEQLGVAPLFIFDQFEDFFLYHSESKVGQLFDEEFARAVNREDLDVGFLISLREDALAKLDRFNARIPDLLGNPIRLAHLDNRSAEEAIRNPLERYNRDFGLPPATIEDVLVRELIRSARRQELGAAGGASHSAGESEKAPIETALLQLLLTKLWKAAPYTEDGRTLRLQNLQDMGGAEKVMERYLDEIMEPLTPQQKAASFRIFDRLVTPSGGKVACREKDLLAWAGELRSQLPEVLEHLSRGDNRVLRPIAPALGDKGGRQFEIFHDVLADPILEWRRAFMAELERAALERQAQEERAKLEREAAEQRARAEEQHALAQELARAAILAEQRGQIALSRSLAAAAVNSGWTDPELGVLLGLHAVRTSMSLDADVQIDAADALGQALDAHKLRLTTPVTHDRITEIALSPDARHMVLEGPGVHELPILDLAGRRELVLEGCAVEFLSPQFDPKGERIAAIACLDDKDVIRLWDAKTGRLILPELDIPQDSSGCLDSAERCRARTLRFSQDGTKLAAGGQYTAWIWTLDGKAMPPKVLPGHEDEQGNLYNVTALAFHPRQPILATAASDNSINLWNLYKNKKPKRLLGHSDKIYSLNFNLNGKDLLSASEDLTARIWDVASGRQRLELLGHASTVFSAAYSPDGARIVTAGADPAVCIWDAISARLLARLLPHRCPVVWARFSEGGNQVITAGWDGTVRTSDAGGHIGRVHSVRFDPTGRTVATADDRSILLWDTSSGGILRALETECVHHGHIVDIRYSGDGEKLVSGDAAGRIAIWDTESGQPSASWPGCAGSGRIKCLAVNRNGSRVVVASGFDGVKLCSAGQQQEELLSAPRNQAEQVAFSPDGNWIAASTMDGQVYLWSAENPAGGFDWEAHAGRVQELSFSPNSKMLLTEGEDGAAKVWSLAMNGKVAHATIRNKLEGHKNNVMSGVFASDGSRLYTADLDGLILEWDIRAPGNPNGRELFRHGVLATLDLSRDGSRLASFSWDRTSRLWDTASGQELARFTHREMVNGGALSPNGLRIATLTPYNGIRIIPVDTKELVAVAKARVSRDLTPEECQRYLNGQDCKLER
jgi:WD40 repeat protein